MEDCCAVCAEPLEWVAYGKCGHKDACSKCVARLRFVLKDDRCVICQQSLQVVFVTKYLGSYTKTVSAAEIDELQVRSEITSNKRHVAGALVRLNLHLVTRTFQALVIA